MMSRARQHLHFHFLIPLLFSVCLTASAAIDSAIQDSNDDSVSGARRDADNIAGDATLAPAFTPIPELTSGFQLLYAQQFPEAREKFTTWESEHPQEPFGEVAVTASYLFEEFYRQGVLTSDFFLNEEKFLNGIDGKPDPGRMAQFQGALVRTRTLANKRLKQSPRDIEALFALTLAAGMESDADMILRKERLEALKLLKLANQYAKQLLAVRSDAHDAYVALGSANYIIGSLSGGMRFFLSFGGVHGDRKLGMQQVGKIGRA